MNRFWSILFFLVPIIGTAAFVLAAMDMVPFSSAWLPENFSESGNAIDELFYLVHWICAFFFLLTGLLIGFIVWRFANPNSEAARYVKGNLKLELIWSIIPGGILVFLALYQMNAWSARRVERPVVSSAGQQIEQPALVHVIAKQFGWEFHYAGRDGRFGTPDDFAVENLMVVPVDQTIVFQLESRDVIHSFFVPKLRLKHDVVPGMSQTAWFKPTGTATINIICAELCGWGHYKMNAVLKIVSRNEFEAWLQHQQQRFEPPELTPYSRSMP